MSLGSFFYTHLYGIEILSKVFIAFFLYLLQIRSNLFYWSSSALKSKCALVGQTWFVQMCACIHPAVQWAPEGEQCWLLEMLGLLLQVRERFGSCLGIF